ncbi:MFS domain-containing protein [Mycena chlorophos]|uniref:MFS domain-containing protein n=1 Tax=Mycena chlorophos TaxID=658473 RepID=A0A8H6TPQ0_MYCCL|nr:MFS domain-containing protein [Mycena chlorophos]
MSSGANDASDNPAPAKDAHKERTPMPKMQLFILLAVQFAEPVTALVIYPFVVQFVRDIGVTHGDETKVGFYAGILESSFFLAESLTVFQFGRLSDTYGRRPVLLFAPLGLALSMLGFGLSSNYWSMLFWRCVQGMGNGNTGVARTAMSEISDESNIADMFSFLPLTWSTGVTLGPAMGGILANPATKWPDSVLGHIELLRVHPYFLPCAVAGSVAFAAFVLAWIGLKESLPSALKKKAVDLSPTETSPLLPPSESSASSSTTALANDSSAKDEDERLPIRALLTRPVVIALINHGFLSFTEMSHSALLPIIYATPIELGGLGLLPHSIGLLMGSVGIVNAVIQASLGGWTIRRFGARTVFTAGFVAITLELLAYPVLNLLARRAGRVDAFVWLAIAAQLSCSVFVYFAYSVTSLFVLASSPNRGNVGAVSGLSATLSTSLRALAPTIATSLFALSVTHDVLRGYAGFLVLAAVALGGVRATRMLPKEPGNGSTPSSSNASSGDSATPDAAASGASG